MKKTIQIENILIVQTNYLNVSVMLYNINLIK